MASALSVWAKQSPIEAAAYTQTIEDPLTRDNAYKNLLQTWSSQDPASAARFLSAAAADVA